MVNTFIVFVSFQTLITLVCSKDLSLENKLLIEMKLKYKRTFIEDIIWPHGDMKFLFEF